MSIGPLDILKTQEATQVKHMEGQRAQHAQEQISRNFQTLVHEEHQKPNQTTKTDNNEYRYDAKEKGNNQFYEQSGKKKDRKEEKKESKQPPKSGGIDILI